MSEEKALETERLIEDIRCQVSSLLQASVEEHKRKLLKENGELLKNVENLKKSMANFKCDTILQTEGNDKPAKPVDSSPGKSIEAQVKSNNNAAPTPDASSQPEEKPSKKTKAPKVAKAPANQADSLPVDVGRLDFRIGRIIEAEKHPDADTLYVEKIDVGEEQPRTVVSGLVRHIPIEGIVNKLVVVMCNLKPAKMRGITSQAMVMCASTPEKVELLIPPSNCIPGDLVEVDGYPRVPDVVLNPKKRIFEACAPDLKTSSTGLATYKGITWQVKGKGEINSTLNEVQIK